MLTRLGTISWRLLGMSRFATSSQKCWACSLRLDLAFSGHGSLRHIARLPTWFGRSGVDETRSHLVKCFSGIFPGLSTTEISQATPESTDGWDSLTSVTLLLMIEEEFGIEVDIESVEEFTSFEQILSYLQKKQAKTHTLP